MASIISVISFLILLLATCSYSAPFKHGYEQSTPNYEFTTGTTVVERESSFDTRFISDNESTVVPTTHENRSVEESSSEEVTTLSDVTLSPRSVDDSQSSSDESNDKRGLQPFSFTTWESSTEFNRRAIRPTESQEETETTSVLPENSVEVTTNFEPSSSVESFGKFTGLLPHDETEEISTTPFPVKTQRITKTVSIIPGKITETKIYLNVPTEKPVTVVTSQKEFKKGGRQPIVTTAVPVEEIGV